MFATTESVQLQSVYFKSDIEGLLLTATPSSDETGILKSGDGGRIWYPLAKQELAADGKAGPGLQEIACRWNVGKLRQFLLNGVPVEGR